MVSWWRGTDGGQGCKITTRSCEVSQSTVIAAVLPNGEGSRAIDLSNEHFCRVWRPQIGVVRAEVRPPVLLLLAEASASEASLDVVMQQSHGLMLATVYMGSVEPCEVLME